MSHFIKFIKKNDKNKNTASNLQNFLIKNNISYKTEVLREIRSANRSLNEAFENIVWHLEISDVKFDENEIKNTLLKMQKDVFIKDVIKSKMRVLVF